jgi:hypothetical protein
MVLQEDAQMVQTDLPSQFKAQVPCLDPSDLVVDIPAFTPTRSKTMTSRSLLTMGISPHSMAPSTITIVSSKMTMNKVQGPIQVEVLEPFPVVVQEVQDHVPDVPSIPHPNNSSF